MQLYCVVVECKDKTKDDDYEVRIDHFFADSKEHMEDRIVEIVKDIKSNNIETLKHTIFPIEKVDGIDFNKLLNLFYFEEPRKGE